MRSGPAKFWSVDVTKFEDAKFLRGSGFSHFRFGGPGEKTPCTARQAFRPFAEPRRLHCRRFAVKHKGFLAQVVNRAAPTVLRRHSEKKKEL
jgi:hypothetical protein